MAFKLWYLCFLAEWSNMSGLGVKELWSNGPYKEYTTSYFVDKLSREKITYIFDILFRCSCNIAILKLFYSRQKLKTGIFKVLKGSIYRISEEKFKRKTQGLYIVNRKTTEKHIHLFLCFSLHWFLSHNRIVFRAVVSVPTFAMVSLWGKVTPPFLVKVPFCLGVTQALTTAAEVSQPAFRRPPSAIKMKVRIVLECLCSLRTSAENTGWPTWICSSPCALCVERQVLLSFTGQRCSQSRRTHKGTKIEIWLFLVQMLSYWHHGEWFAGMCSHCEIWA